MAYHWYEMSKEHPLRKYRRSNNLTAAQLAKTLKVCPASVTHYENGIRRIDAERAISIERLIGIDRADLRPDLFKRAA